MMINGLSILKFRNKNYFILKCDVMQFERQVPTLQMKLLSPNSRKKSCEGTSFLQNVGNYKAGYTAPRHKGWNMELFDVSWHFFFISHSSRQQAR
jgi:hypothetical protein